MILQANVEPSPKKSKSQIFQKHIFSNFLILPLNSVRRQQFTRARRQLVRCQTRKFIGNVKTVGDVRF